MERYDGIVFTGGESAPPSVIKKLCGEEGLFVVCADSGWEAAAREGVRVDRIVGDFDSLRIPLPSSADVCRYPRAKDFTDTEAAFRAALEAGCRSVVLLGGGGGRMDHWMALRSLFARLPQWRRWETKRESVFKIERGETWRPESVKAPAVVSVFALTATASVETGGFRWPLNGYPLNGFSFSLSNEIIDSQASLTVLSGTVAVTVPRTDASPVSD